MHLRRWPEKPPDLYQPESPDSLRQSWCEPLLQRPATPQGGQPPKQPLRQVIDAIRYLVRTAALGGCCQTHHTAMVTWAQGRADDPDVLPALISHRQSRPSPHDTIQPSLRAVVLTRAWPSRHTRGAVAAGPRPACRFEQREHRLFGEFSGVGALLDQVVEQHTHKRLAAPVAARLSSRRPVSAHPPGSAPRRRRSRARCRAPFRR
jgi:hypothetical protein